jgi:Flp pilus assembly protein TadD
MSLDLPELPRSSPRRFNMLAGAGIVLLTLATFQGLLTHSFTTWDDPLTISANPRLNPPTLDGLAWHWANSYMSLYVPLTYSLWWLVAALSHVFMSADSALPAWPFALTNIVLHAFAAVLVYRLVLRLSNHRTGAAVSAAVFAVHPLQVESVAWLSGTKDLLAGGLVLLALLLYVRAVDPRGPGAEAPKTRGLLLTAFVTLLATLAKPTAIVAPLMTFAMDTLAWRRRPSAALRSSAYLLAAIVPALIWTPLVQAGPSGDRLSVLDRLLVAGDALAFYFDKLVRPASLGIDYGRTPEAVLALPSSRFVWLIPATVASVALVMRRREPLLTLGFAWFLIGVLPVLGFLPFDFQQYSTVADHYMYLSMAGVAVWIGWVGSAHRVAPPLLGLLVIAFVIRSAAQADVWTNSRTLFTHALTVNGDSFAAHNSLAVAELTEGRPQEAVRLAQRAIELRPGRVEAHVTFGNAKLALGELDQAEAAFRRAIEIAPNDGKAYSNLAALLAQRGRLSEALSFIGEALRLDPEDPQSRLNYGTMLAEKGDLLAAEAELRTAIRLAPRDLRARLNLGLVLLGMNRRAEAAEQFRMALRIDPNSKLAKEQLAALGESAP